MTQARIAVALPGVALALFGVFRLLTEVGGSGLLVLVFWLVGAVAIHDGLVAPLTVAVGAVLARFVPARARTYVQATLIAGALVTVVALPMIYRRNSQPRVKAILQQDYGANLATLLTVIVGGATILYALRVIRERRRTRIRLRSGDTSSEPEPGA